MIFVGVDLGTSALKCGAWDANGRRRAFAVSEKFARSELQDAEIWRIELERALARIVAELDGEAITALAVGGHAPSPVFCDAELRPLALVPTWRSERANGEFERLCTIEPMLRAPSDARLEARLAAHAIALLQEQPSLEREIEVLLASWEFLLAHLTGVRATTTASTNLDIARTAGIPNWRPSLRRGPAEIVGNSTTVLASSTGLRAGTPVIVGGLDSRLASIGSGIHELGQACINVGSTAIVAQLVPLGPDARFELGGLGLISESVRLEGDSFAPASRALDAIAARFGVARSVRVVGGLFEDVRLHQLLCDTLARPIEIPTEPQATALGAAMQAAVGVRAFSSLADAAKAMVSVRERLSPR